MNVDSDLTIFIKYRSNWKLIEMKGEKIFVHIDISEEGKPPKIFHSARLKWSGDRFHINLFSNEVEVKRKLFSHLTWNGLVTSRVAVDIRIRIRIRMFSCGCYANVREVVNIGLCRYRVGLKFTSYAEESIFYFSNIQCTVLAKKRAT